uniref:Large ribosomal subunit protein P2 n=1 Tax=Ciona intestinalis TaxID=7719 RepID=F6RRL3_CIOIN|nr:60S acidic ribosomal protein P2 [Ciona intestinalis]|eukprot:XP_026692658.1 60S acidic ribosomal protein P2 [Ciona intestinalis]
MRYVAAYLLAALGGNESPSSSDIKNILGSVGIDVDDDKLNMVIKELKGKNLEEVIAAGNEKLASVPSGGGGAVAASGGAAAADEAPKEEAKKEESEEESDDDMGFGLFD